MASGKLMLITGVSSGFGRALAQEALAAGYTVVGTVRSAQAAQDFDALSAQAFARVLDVTDFDRIDGVVADIEANVGRRRPGEQRRLRARRDHGRGAAR